MAAQLFGDRLYLPRGHTLDVHFRQRAHQRLLTPLISFENLRPESPLSILRHPQLQLAHSRDQRPAIGARSVAQSLRGPLSLAGLQRLFHLQFQHLLDYLSHHCLQKVFLPSHQIFPVLLRYAILLSGHLFLSLLQRLTESERFSMTHSFLQNS